MSGDRGMSKIARQTKLKAQEIEVHGIVIESGILPPPVNMTSPWAHLAWKMKINDSVVVRNFEHYLKLKYALYRLGFKIVRRRISDTEIRIWKVERKYGKNKKIPKCVLYSARTQTVITGSGES